MYTDSKALYGLKQNLRGLYDTLSKFLVEHDFTFGTIDKILLRFTKGDHSLFVQIYVDNIISGSINRYYVKNFIS